jgi:hypothetical protein
VSTEEALEGVYAAEEVDDYLLQMHAHVADLEGEIAARRADLARGVVQTNSSERVLGEALLRAQRSSDEIVAEGRADADRLLASARAEHAGRVEAAQGEAQNTVDAARRDAAASIELAQQAAQATMAQARQAADAILSHAERRASADRGVDARLARARKEAQAALVEAQDSGAALTTEWPSAFADTAVEVADNEDASINLEEDPSTEAADDLDDASDVADPTAFEVTESADLGDEVEVLDDRTELAGRDSNGLGVRIDLDQLPPPVASAWSPPDRMAAWPPPQAPASPAPRPAHAEAPPAEVLPPDLNRVLAARSQSWREAPQPTGVGVAPAGGGDVPVEWAIPPHTEQPAAKHRRIIGRRRRPR